LFLVIAINWYGYMVASFGFDALISGKWQRLGNVREMSAREAYHWACNMKAIIDPEFDAIRLMRGSDVEASENQ
jgi:hypothetical protein